METWLSGAASDTTNIKKNKKWLEFCLCPVATSRSCLHMPPSVGAVLPSPVSLRGSHGWIWTGKLISENVENSLNRIHHLTPRPTLRFLTCSSQPLCQTRRWFMQTWIMSTSDQLHYLLDESHCLHRNISAVLTRSCRGHNLQTAFSTLSILKSPLLYLATGAFETNLEVYFGPLLCPGFH